MLQCRTEEEQKLMFGRDGLPDASSVRAQYHHLLANSRLEDWPSASPRSSSQPQCDVRLPLLIKVVPLQSVCCLCGRRASSFPRCLRVGLSRPACPCRGSC